jgi:glycosyltransferase involved in cell wall biosynthesis
MALFALRSGRARHVDLVVCHGGESWLTVLLLRLLRTRARLVHHSNGLEPRISEEMLCNSGSDTHSGQPRRWWQFRGHALLRLAYTQVDALVLVSPLEWRYALLMRYQPVARLLAVETPLPAGFHGLSFNAQRPLILGYCGGWYARKGVGLVTECGIALLRRYPGLHLHLAGVGADLPVADLFPPDVAARVRVEPFIADKPALQHWYSQVSVFLMPSLSESFGLVVSEAMACGCAVVASNTGFAAGLESGVEALIVDGYTAADYTLAVQRLLDDDDLRRDIAARGHARVQRLRWSEAGGRLEQFYRGLLPAPTGRTREAIRP